jgi:hypothetical protein
MSPRATIETEKVKAMKGTGIFHRILAALVVATGVGIVWALLAVWIGTLSESLGRGGDRIYESVNVSRSGVPVIQSYSTANYQILSYRTLDGKPLEIEREDWLGGAGLTEPRRPPGLFNLPVSWRIRIAAASDLQRPPNSWYLIRDDHPLGHAYLAGFDDFSRRPIGYIGRRGFRSGTPPRDEWFDVGRHQFGWGSGAVCSTTYLNYGGRAYSYMSAADEQRLPEWLLFVIDGDRVLEIDLRVHSVRSLYESPNLVSIGILSEIQPPSIDKSAIRESGIRAQTAAFQTGQLRVDVIAPATGAASERVKVENRLAIRTADRIVVLDPPTGAIQEFPLPESWRDQSLSAYGLSDHELLLSHWDRSPLYVVHFAWLKSDGQVTREASETLAGYRPQNERTSAMLATLAGPVPIAWYVVTGTVAPLSMVQERRAPTYAAGLAQIFDIVGPALLIVTLVGCALAWLTWKWQRKYHRPYTAAWCVFVFLAGLPGLLAYWLEHRRVRLDTCGECGAKVPRDRDACASCEAPFAVPPPVGTEIFA